MAFSLQNTIAIGAGGAGVNRSFTVTSDGDQGAIVSLPAGFTGTLTTRTDNAIGIATVTNSPVGLITTSDKVMISWAAGYRRNCTVTAVTSTTIAISVGEGTNLPVTTTVVIVAKQINTAFNLVANNLALMAADCDQSCHCDFTAAAAFSTALALLGSTPYVYYPNAGLTNLLAGVTVDGIWAANNSVTAATLKVGASYDATP